MTDDGAWDFWKDVLLLLIAFLLTVLLGQNISNHYVKKERQEERRYDVIDAGSSAISASIGGLHDGWSIYAFHLTTDEIQERRRFWQETNRDWRVQYPTIYQDLQIHFPGSGLSLIFCDLVLDRRQAGNILQNLLEDHPFGLQDTTDQRIEQLGQSIRGLSILLREWGQLAAYELDAKNANVPSRVVDSVEMLESDSCDRIFESRRTPESR